MTITYPIDFPSDVGMVDAVFTSRNAVSSSTSPFSFTEQVYSWAGQRWEVEVQMPRMNRTQAELYHSFLTKLKGKTGTFTMYVPSSRTAQSTFSQPISEDHVLTDPSGNHITTEGGDALVVDYGDIVVLGSLQVGNTLNITGYTKNTSEVVIAGDYFQIGTGASTRLYKALNNANSDASGSVTVDIYPNLRSSPLNGDQVIWDNPKGLFRLVDNSITIESDNMNTFFIGFMAVEAL